MEVAWEEPGATPPDPNKALEPTGSPRRRLGTPKSKARGSPKAGKRGKKNTKGSNNCFVCPLKKKPKSKFCSDHHKPYENMKNQALAAKELDTFQQLMDDPEKARVAISDFMNDNPPGRFQKKLVDWAKLRKKHGVAIRFKTRESQEQIDISDYVSRWLKKHVVDHIPTEEDKQRARAAWDNDCKVKENVEEGVGGEKLLWVALPKKREREEEKYFDMGLEQESKKHFNVDATDKAELLGWIGSAASHQAASWTSNALGSGSGWKPSDMDTKDDDKEEDGTPNKSPGKPSPDVIQDLVQEASNLHKQYDKEAVRIDELAKKCDQDCQETLRKWKSNGLDIHDASNQLQIKSFSLRYVALQLFRRQDTNTTSEEWGKLAVPVLQGTVPALEDGAIPPKADESAKLEESNTWMQSLADGATEDRKVSCSLIDFIITCGKYQPAVSAHEHVISLVEMKSLCSQFVNVSSVEELKKLEEKVSEGCAMARQLLTGIAKSAKTLKGTIQSSSRQAEATRRQAAKNQMKAELDAIRKTAKEAQDRMKVKPEGSGAGLSKVSRETLQKMLDDGLLQPFTVLDKKDMSLEEHLDAPCKVINHAAHTPFTNDAALQASVATYGSTYKKVGKVSLQETGSTQSPVTKADQKDKIMDYFSKLKSTWPGENTVTAIPDGIAGALDSAWFYGFNSPHFSVYTVPNGLPNFKLLFAGEVAHIAFDIVSLVAHVKKKNTLLTSPSIDELKDFATNLDAGSLAEALGDNVKAWYCTQSPHETLFLPSAFMVAEQVAKGALVYGVRHSTITKTKVTRERYDALLKTYRSAKKPVDKMELALTAM